MAQHKAALLMAAAAAAKALTAATYDPDRPADHGFYGIAVEVLRGDDELDDDQWEKLDEVEWGVDAPEAGPWTPTCDYTARDWATADPEALAGVRAVRFYDSDGNRGGACRSLADVARSRSRWQA